MEEAEEESVNLLSSFVRANHIIPCFDQSSYLSFLFGLSGFLSSHRVDHIKGRHADFSDLTVLL